MFDPGFNILVVYIVAFLHVSDVRAVSGPNVDIILRRLHECHAVVCGILIPTELFPQDQRRIQRTLIKITGYGSFPSRGNFFHALPLC